jgi:hypothetical protein
MVLERTPLAVDQLSATAQKAIAGGATKMMAARGLMPMAPVDQAAVLYQLTLDSDAAVAAASRATAVGLPEKILLGLVASRFDPRILDFFTMLHVDKPIVLETAILNPATADLTIAELAARAAPREIDLIAQNEVRLLRHPEIIGAMYLNPRARMSTVDRAVELAVRNQVRVPGVPAWDEVARALSGGLPPCSEDADALFALAATKLSGDDSLLTVGDPESLELVGGEIQDFAELPPEVAQTQISKLSIPAKIRLAMIGNAFARSLLIRDPMRIVAMAAIKSERVTIFEAARYIGNHSLGEDVIKFIAQKREWTKPYNTKLALCMNPKVPVADVARLLPHLRDKDLRNLSKSKGIPSAVAAQARRLLMQRSAPPK